MSRPLLSIIIPTHNRPDLLRRAVGSALAQTIEDLEVLVVDDASTQPIELPPDPRLKLIRLEKSRGGAGARNVGTEAAQGRWITYLDDDDRLLPPMVETSLAALNKATLPAPVGVISGIELVDPTDRVIRKLLPPPQRLQGAHFALEELEEGCSYNTKQTLVVEREVILQIGGWDETFRSRVHSELFLRLNPVCSILGLPVVSYQLSVHEGARVSTNPELRQASFRQLLEKHHTLFEAHPKMFANFVYEHAYTSYKMGQMGAAFLNVCWALRLHPSHTLSRFYHLFAN
ncbi:glycosyltransferase [Myxacorys almedinensis]|uniref:Glycosyltransferase n=1 Tax=Myxacorys almedinensis A TaxID=2690445 RepID=A0A8J7Z1T3_9CYAN|nr:glycosyltransferase [Myxacorys almedinensis A]